MSDCKCCGECSPYGNPCAACQAGGICDCAFEWRSHSCDNDDYETGYDEGEDND